MIRYIIAILLPWASFFLLDRPLYAIICLGLQVSLIGWIPAAIWAVYAQFQANRLEKNNVVPPKQQPPTPE